MPIHSVTTRCTLAISMALGTLPGCSRAQADADEADASAATGKADEATGDGLDDVRVTILSTHLADHWRADHHGDSLPQYEGRAGDPVGHEGWSALVEYVQDGTTRSVLFDAGSRADIILRNAKIFGVEDALANTEEVVLSHWHYDHTDGLPELREALMHLNPNALSTVYVSKHSFAQRNLPAASNINSLPAKIDAWKQTFQNQADANLVLLDEAPFEVAPNVWTTGFVPRRVHTTSIGDLEEISYPGVVTLAEPILVEHEGARIELAEGDVDIVPDSVSLVLKSTEGLTVVTGCGHAGVANIVAHAREFTQTPRVVGVLGGLHIWQTSESYVERLGVALFDLDVEQILAGHCSGINPVFILREAMGLSDQECAVASVGFGYHLARGGIQLGQVAQSLPVH